MINRIPIRRRQLLGLLFSATSVASLAACTSGGDLPPLPETGPHPYHLGSGDQVRVIVFGEDQLSGEFKVSDSGTVTLPLVGSLRADGLTVPELQAAIVKMLVDRKLFPDPNVSVEISTYRPISILGEVARPGEYPYRPGMTVLRAVALAGGFTYRAVEEYASILRTVDGVAVEGRVKRQTFVEPGDIITIFELRL